MTITNIGQTPDRSAFRHGSVLGFNKRTAERLMKAAGKNDASVEFSEEKSTQLSKAVAEVLGADY